MGHPQSRVIPPGALPRVRAFADWPSSPRSDGARREGEHSESETDVEALSRAHQLFAGSTRTTYSLDAGTGHYVGDSQRAALTATPWHTAVPGRWTMPATPGRGGRHRQPASDIIAGAPAIKPGPRIDPSVLDGPARMPTLCRQPRWPSERRAPPGRSATRPTRSRSDSPHSCATAPRRIASIALSATGIGTARAAGRPSRNRGACRIVPVGPAICVGRSVPTSSTVRPGQVVLCAGRYSPGSHHLSADQRWHSGVPFSGAARRSRLPARRSRPARHRKQSGCGGALFGATVRISRLGNNVAIRRPI